ncbi:hypothetical protein GQX73_g10509 [Xylaria multiplex]|uniref:Uncharacterized protein n=1 Tax=Xylaria multiplex TaxID=323545 RepID=A0A7C8IL05_9PEZI|nr:hypothetical protein GQX73_g10509 [Xylaria multiplex]
MTPNTPASHATSTQSSSSQATTAATATHNAARPPSLDVSSQTLITIINPSIPLPSPTSPAGPPFSKKEAPPVLKILAIVISVVVSVVLLSIVLRQLVVRRRQRRSQQRQSLYPDASEDLFPAPDPGPPPRAAPIPWRRRTTVRSVGPCMSWSIRRPRGDGAGPRRLIVRARRGLGQRGDERWIRNSGV